MKFGLLAATSLAAVFSFNADAVEPYQEYHKRVEASQTLTALTSELMGESVSLYNGATQFEATDIALGGNNPLPVQLSRSFSVELTPGGSSSFDSSLGGAGNWNVDVPHISTTGTVGAGWPNTRCSVGATPVATGFQSTDFWRGNAVHVPGEGDRNMLVMTAEVPRIADGVSRLWTTRERDMFSCIPMKSGLAGEGFLMQTASGVKYYFDVAVSRYMGYMTRSVPDLPNPLTVNRTKFYLLASKIEDRFGNSVSFSYNANGHPTSISSNDGRAISLSYSGALLTSASAHGRTWQYQYGTGANAGKLASVVLPDGSTWKYAYSGTLTPDYVAWDGGSSATCSIQPTELQADFELTVGHPSGASGKFKFGNVRHYRAGIHRSECLKRTLAGGGYYHVLNTPNFFDVMSLQSKTLSGPGLTSQVWSYSYGGSAQALWGGTGAAVYPCTTCPSEKLVTVTEPDATKKVYRYGFLFAQNEGRLLGTTVLDAAGVTRRVESTTYMTDAQVVGQPFHPRYGNIVNGDDPSTATVRPIVGGNIVQDATTFSWQANSFDEFGRPSSITKSSAPAQ